MKTDAALRERLRSVANDHVNRQTSTYRRDATLIERSEALRRLEELAQIWAVTDIQRNRQIHSVETGRLGVGILDSLRKRFPNDQEVQATLPPRELLRAACLAHDIGLPPFGKTGEQALQARMWNRGGFEANAQTFRIFARSETVGIQIRLNPTRRFILAILKYPIRYSDFDSGKHRSIPPKCYFDTEECVVDWALCNGRFPAHDIEKFRSERLDGGRPKHRSFDCSILECADGFEYSVGDLEYGVARDMVDVENIFESLDPIFREFGPRIKIGSQTISFSTLERGLFGESRERRRFCRWLLELLVSSIEIRRKGGFEHSLFRLEACVDEPIEAFLKGLGRITTQGLLQRPSAKERQQQGKRILGRVFDELFATGGKSNSVEALTVRNSEDSLGRSACDVVCRLTDRRAIDAYCRLVSDKK